MIFKEEIWNAELDKKGYIILPFFNAEQVYALQAIYSQNKSESPYFHSTTFLKNVEQKNKVTAQVTEVFEQNIQSLFYNPKRMGASFLTKPSGSGGHMPIHQDWTIVDETEFGSYTIWVPLQDVSASNGAITVLDGSHKLSAALRGPTLPVVFKDIEPAINQRMKTLNMKAGEAFIFNHALIHASHLNNSDKDRVAVTFGLIPNNASLLFYHLNEDKTIAKYEVADDFFMHYDTHGERPTVIDPTEILQQEFNQLTNAQFLAFNTAYKSKTMKTLFKNKDLQTQYEQEGYVLVDMLSETEVQELKDYYKTLDNDHIPSYGFHVSLDNSSADFVVNVMSKIKSVITKHADELFADYKIFTSSYVVKEKNPVGVVPPHQDWSFTEEDEGYNSATVWTALVDTNMLNGAMGVIKGSHTFFDHHRASPAPQFKTPLDPHLFSIFPYLKLLPMKAGQALIFNNKTIHASPPNISDEVRLAVGFGVTQADAPLRHFYLKPGSDAKKLDKYEVDDYFYSHFNNGKLAALYAENKSPEGLKFIETVDNRVQDISADDLIAKMKAAGNIFNIEMVEHLAKLFNYNIDGSKKEVPKQEVEETVEQAQVEQPPNSVWIDDRPFFIKYSPLNIAREIKKRIVA